MSDLPTGAKSVTAEQFSAAQGRAPSALEASEAECAAGRTAPRVSLASMEAKVAATYHFTANAALKGMNMPALPSLDLLSICILVMKNGFTVIGKSAPASAANFDADLGRKLAYEDAIRQLWPLEGYQLRSELANNMEKSA